MAKLYFTFGSNTNLHNHYVIIEAESTLACFSKMQEAYGNKWAFHYTEEEFKDQPKKYNLTEVPLGTTIWNNY